jgi:hypothetical protein
VQESKGSEVFTPFVFLSGPWKLPCITLPVLMHPIFCHLFKVVCLPRVSRVVDIISVLRTNKHNGFPVSYVRSC